jgi:hypothetical protein
MKQTIILVGGMLLTLAGIVGHVWHKYFAITGTSRFTDFHKYVSEHWYFWVAILVGVLLVWIGIRMHPTKR